MDVSVILLTLRVSPLFCTLSETLQVGGPHFPRVGRCPAVQYRLPCTGLCGPPSVHPGDWEATPTSEVSLVLRGSDQGVGAPAGRGDGRGRGAASTPTRTAETQVPPHPPETDPVKTPAGPSEMVGIPVSPRKDPPEVTESCSRTDRRPACRRGT